MNFINLTLESALEKQSLGEIIIVDPSPSSLPAVNLPEGHSWKKNFNDLCIKVPHLPTTKVISFFKPKYSIGYYTKDESQESVEHVWRYFYGVENKSISNFQKDTIEYIYILTNPEFPGMVKIGMTTDEVEKRVASINNASTLYEWEPVFALPVSKGNAYHVEQTVHKFFDDVRVSSNKGSKREFFKLSPFTAFDKVREIGAFFQVGDPIIF